MTRESKLALIIGFTLILVVGVLLSDHLSSASGASFDATPEPIAQTPVSPLPSDDPIARLDPTPVDPGPVVIQNGSRSTTRPSGILADAGRHVDNAIDRFRETEQPVLMDLVPAESSSTRTVPTREPTRPVAIGGSRADTHTVREGDTLYAIARRYLGDGNRWGEIHRLNADKLGPDALLKVGMVLRLRSGIADATPRQAEPPAERQADPATYVVKKGDVLSLISQELLGSARRMDEIVELNGLDDADDIRVGMTLKIPAR